MSEEHTGLSSSYYTVEIKHPTIKERPAYLAECNDIIEALGMTYAEGNIFKGVWRRCASRTLDKNKKGNNAKYDAEKILFFAHRLMEEYNSADSFISKETVQSIEELMKDKVFKPQHQKSWAGPLRAPDPDRTSDTSIVPEIVFDTLSETK